MIARSFASSSSKYSFTSRFNTAYFPIFFLHILHMRQEYRRTIKFLLYTHAARILPAQSSPIGYVWHSSMTSQEVGAWDCCSCHPALGGDHIREVAGYIIHSYTVGIVTSCISIEVVGVEKVSMLPLVCRQDDAPLTLELTHEMSEERDNHELQTTHLPHQAH